MTPAPAPVRVLVVQTSFLGDMVLATPVLAALRRAWPDAHLAVLARPQVASILHGHRDVDEILVHDKLGLHGGLSGLLRQVRCLRRGHFDLALSLHRSTRTALLLTLAEIPLRIGFRQSELSLLYHRRVWRDPGRHDIERQLSILDAIGVPHEGREALPHLMVAAEARHEVEALLAAAGIGPRRGYTVLVPGASWYSKQWMPQRFAEVARALLQRGEAVVLVGVASEIGTGEEIQRLAPGCVSLIGRTDPSWMAAAIARASAVVCNDSAAMHVTQALGVPLVAVVGPTSDAQGFMPRAPRSLVVRDASLTCRPQCRFGGISCPLGTRACLEHVTSAQVLAALDEVRRPAGAESEIAIEDEHGNECGVELGRR